MCTTVNYYLFFLYRSGGPCGVMVKALDGGIVATEFEIQLRYYSLSDILCLYKCVVSSCYLANTDSSVCKR